MTNRPSNSLHCTALIMMLIVIINYVFTGVKRQSAPMQVYV